MPDRRAAPPPLDMLAGYVHLRAQTQGQTQQQAPTAEQARLLSAAIQRELAPILERLQRLEDRLN